MFKVKVILSTYLVAPNDKCPLITNQSAIGLKTKLNPDIHMYGKADIKPLSSKEKCCMFFKYVGISVRRV